VKKDAKKLVKIDTKKLGELEKELGPFLWTLPSSGEKLRNSFAPMAVGKDWIERLPQPYLRSGPKKNVPREHWGFYQLVGQYAEGLTDLIIELNKSAPEGFPSERIATLMVIGVFAEEVFAEELVIDEYHDILVRSFALWPDWTLRFLTSVRLSWSEISAKHQPELLVTCFSRSSDFTDNWVLEVLGRHFPFYKNMKEEAFRGRRREILKALGT